VGRKHRHGSPLLDARSRNGRGRGDRRRIQRRILAEDRAVQLLELAPGLGADLVDEDAPGRCVRLEGVSLPPGAVEREHQLPPQTLAVRLLPHELL
jgi:hypothetical protein